MDTENPDVETVIDGEQPDDSGLTIDDLAKFDEQDAEGQDDDGTPEEGADGTDEPDGEGSQDDSPDDAWKTRKVTVQIDGKPTEITLDEAVNGYIRQADYTRKTQELSHQQSQVQEQQHRLQTDIAQRYNQLQTLSTALYQELVGDQQALNALTDNPTEYLKRQTEMNRKVQLLNQVQAQQEQVRQAAASEQAQALARQAQESDQKLASLIPGWNDPPKRQAIQREVGEYLRSIGYSSDDLNALTDHRAFLVARDAALWRKSQKLAQAKAKGAPAKAVKPGTSGKSDNSAVVRARERFKAHSDSIDALAALGAAAGSI